MPVVQNYYKRKSQSSTTLIAGISTKTGLKAVSLLRTNAPKFTGHLVSSIVGKLVLFKYMSRYWINFLVPYAYYANYGRPAVQVKNKKTLRWFTTPASTMDNGTKVFRKRSGAAGTFAGATRFKSGNMVMFIENTTMTMNGDLMRVAEQELQRWLLN